MPSPFPGMNPYLEQRALWQDFHQSLIPLARELINAQIAPDYVARVEEHLFVHELSAEERRFMGRADVAVTGEFAASPAGSPRAAGGTIEAPVYGVLPPPVDVERHAYLEIRGRENQELVTVIELLSPANKLPGPDREQYLVKRRRVLASPAHLVEIDLLRGGPRLPLEGLPACDYCVAVSRAEQRPRVGLWPIRLRDAVPPVPIPLRRPDPDATLDLQHALHRLYDAARYDLFIYRGQPQPPLPPDDLEWAAGFVPRSV